MSASIVLPTLSETRKLLGIRSLLLSHETLREQRTAALLLELRNPKLNPDDRFNAALALRDRNLLDEPHGTLFTESLFRHIHTTASTSRSDGSSVYSMEEKRLGILANIALQGTVLNCPVYLTRLTRWIHNGIFCSGENYSPGNKRTVQGIDIPSDATLSKERKALSRSTAIQRKLNLAHRAVQLLGGTCNDPELGKVVFSALAAVLTVKSSPTSLKVFALNSIATIDSSESLGLMLRSSLGSTPLSGSLSLLQHTFSILSVFVPGGAIAQDLHSGIMEALEKSIVRAQLEGERQLEVEFLEMRSKVNSTVSPLFNSEQVAEARRHLSAGVWRPLIHLSNTDSLLVRAGTSTLAEIVPSGDFTFPRITTIVNN